MDKQTKDISDIINQVHPPENNQSNTNDLEYQKSLELAKIIVQEILNKDNISSLSFLKPEHVNDIVQAKLLNNYYDIPEIDQYILNYLELKRSENGQLIRLLVKLGMNNNIEENENKDGFFSRILKRG